MPRKDREAKRQYEREYVRRPDVKARRAENFSKWREANADRLRERERIRRIEKRAQCLVANARTRARRKGLDFSLDEHVNDLQARIDAGKCELTGYPFSLAPGKPYNSPSLDRIDSNKGYTYENVRVVLHLVNAALGDWGEDILAEVLAPWAMQSMPKRR